MSTKPAVNPLGRLADQRVLITTADQYMGPAIAQRFEEEGAVLIRDNGIYESDPLEPARIVEGAGRVDILVLNLIGAVGGKAEATTEDQWQYVFNRLVHPTMRFVTAVLPQMIERQAGKIIAVTSAVPMRAISGMSTYSAARGAQNTYVRTVGAEVARHNIQFNAIGQHFTKGGFAEDAMEDPKIKDMVMRHVPARRLAEGWEQAELSLFLASQDSNFFVGQVFPFNGGWAAP